MSAASGIFQGWTIEEAIRKTVDPDLLLEWDRAETALREMGPLGRGTIHAGINADNHSEEQARLYREKVRQHKICSDHLKIARNQVQAELFKHLKACQLIARGRYGSAVAQLSALPESAWDSLRVADYQRSTLKERTGSKSLIHDVRIFPLLHSEEATKHLVGLSFKDAFKRFVLDDPEVAILGKQVLQQEGKYAAVFRDGQFPGPFIEFKWPLDLTADSLASQFDGRLVLIIPGPPKPPPSDAVQLVSAVIVERWQALRKILMNGEILAHGTFDKTGVFDAIHPSQWARSGLWVDVRNGDLLEEENRKPVLQWKGLVLEKAGKLFHVQPTEPDSVPSATFSGRTPRASTKGVLRVETKAKSLKACQSWLEQEMHTSPKLRLKPKSNYKEEALEIWQGTITKRAFDRCWENAIQATNATAWSVPGAPKKNHRIENRRAD